MTGNAWRRYLIAKTREKKRPADKQYVFLKKVSYMTTASAESGVWIGGGIWLGAWLDTRFSSSPGFLLGLMGLALIMSTRRVWYYIRQVVALDRPKGQN